MSFSDSPLIAISTEETPLPEYISESKINICIEFKKNHYIFDLEKLANILDLVKCKKSKEEDLYRFIDFEQLGIPGLVTYLDMFSVLVFQSSYSEWENNDQNHPKNLSYKELQRHHGYYKFVEEQNIQISKQNGETKKMNLAYLMILPERNPDPFNRIGYNPITKNEVSLDKVITTENTNVCIWFRYKYYVLDLYSILQNNFHENKKKRYESNTDFFEFDTFGIPELLLESAHFDQVVFGKLDDIEYTIANIKKYLKKRPRYFQVYSSENSPTILEFFLSKGLIFAMDPPDDPKPNPSPNNNKGYNPISMEQLPLKDFIADNTVVCIQYRQTNYIFDLSIVKSQLEKDDKDDKWYEKCEKPDTLDFIRYFNFSDYGIPDLAVDYKNFENVVLGEGFDGPGYDNPQDYKKRPKYYRIIEKGRIKLDRSNWEDPERSGIYNCENENLYTFGVIEFMAPPSSSLDNSSCSNKSNKKCTIMGGKRKGRTYRQQKKKRKTKRYI